MHYEVLKRLLFIFDKGKKQKQLTKIKVAKNHFWY